MTAIIGGLGAAVLWAAATLCSSRSSRMLGSRVVLAWVMLVGVRRRPPARAIVTPVPATSSHRRSRLLGLAGHLLRRRARCSTYAALRIGKVSIVAPIVATEGAVAARHRRRARRHGRARRRASLLAVIAIGVVLSSLEPGRGRRPGRRLRPRRRRPRRAAARPAVAPPGPRPTRRRSRSTTAASVAARRSSRRSSSASASSPAAAPPRSCRSPGSPSRARLVGIVVVIDPARPGAADCG